MRSILPRGTTLSRRSRRTSSSLRLVGARHISQASARRRTPRFFSLSFSRGRTRARSKNAPENGAFLSSQAAKSPPGSLQESACSPSSRKPLASQDLCRSPVRPRRAFFVAQGRALKKLHEVRARRSRSHRASYKSQTASEPIEAKIFLFSAPRRSKAHFAGIRRKANAALFQPVFLAR